jgi:hypothetical protein
MTLIVFMKDFCLLKGGSLPHDHVECDEVWKPLFWLFTHVSLITFSEELDCKRSEFYHFSMVPLGSLSRKEDLRRA